VALCGDMNQLTLHRSGSPFIMGIRDQQWIGYSFNFNTVFISGEFKKQNPTHAFCKTLMKSGIKC